MIKYALEGSLKADLKSISLLPYKILLFSTKTPLVLRRVIRALGAMSKLFPIQSYFC